MKTLHSLLTAIAFIFVGLPAHATPALEQQRRTGKTVAACPYCRAENLTVQATTHTTGFCAVPETCGWMLTTSSICARGHLWSTEYDGAGKAKPGKVQKVTRQQKNPSLVPVQPLHDERLVLPTAANTEAAAPVTPPSLPVIRKIPHRTSVVGAAGMP